MVNMWLYSVLDMGNCGGIIMEIPKNIIHRNRRYELVKAYPNFILYKDKKQGLEKRFKDMI